MIKTVRIKNLFFIVATMFALNALASYTPTFVGGQNQTSARTATIQVPNNLATNTSTSSKYLLETGNNNILANPSFEHVTSSTSWTNSAGSVATDFTNVIGGAQSFKITLTAQTLSFTQSSTMYQAQFADGIQGLAAIWVRSTVAGVSVCSIQAGTVSTTNCVAHSGNGKWEYLKVPFILGGTSNGISIASSGNITGVVTIDDAYVGKQDLKQDNDQSRLAGESYFAGAASCDGWTRASTTLGALATDTDCPGPTVVRSTMGTWATTDADLPRQTITNLPAGTYRATFYGTMTQSSGNSSWSINDGTTTCEGMAANNQTAQLQSSVTCTFNYTSSGDRVFELYAGSTAGTATLVGSFSAAPRASTKFILEYFGNGQIYSASCGANCVTDFSAKISGAGVVSDENVDWINGNTVVTSTSTSTGTFNSNIFTVAPNCTVTSEIEQMVVKVTTSSTTFVTRTNASSTGTATANNYQIHCQKTGADFLATRIIVGSFKNSVTTPNVSTPVLASAYISSTEVITEDDSVMLTSCTNADPAVCTFSTSFWSSAPKCWAQGTVAADLATVNSGTTTTSITIDRGTANSPFALWCHGAKQQ